ncbi:MAG: DUF4384 domain-containing protein [Bacteroidales bacterium]|nr:DUF4384 domain-containing protein [Bacteroidales bacterium]
MRAFLICFMVLSAVAIYAKKKVTVECSYSFVVPEHINIEQAKTIALERAKQKSIADEFGTIVSQSTTTYLSSQNEKSSTAFTSIGNTEVKGEWIETIGEPVYEVKCDNNMLIVEVSVKGKIREIERSRINVLAQVLRNNAKSPNEETDFVEGDDMFLRFKSPADGFLLVYLIDRSEGKAYCLLPYSQSFDIAQSIERDRSYVFFSVTDAAVEEKRIVDEYKMTSISEMDMNDLVIIFSPNEISKVNSVLAHQQLPRVTELAEFEKWLSNIRVQDEKIQVINKFLTIKK